MIEFLATLLFSFALTFTFTFALVIVFAIITTNIINYLKKVLKL